uniref:7 kDa protein n=1 Tax=Grapevine leafroll-associated virus 3 TaxID=55951 RepID=E5KH07_9CLOS|nr:7 kDa protein [Grapevine leafroll-associated virus 3]ADQ57708.1 7 kDa protein [Grapevine leafroll-associated virus 3]ADQ57715.1 7 kDa protein [Grapevine leafroll-associated virus 3]ADQ57722.1 7 kDa protein [Grapevine leafroll-associated virus 3]ADQ57736.1 7 kDa protein [Grapevine leafroll-associated virus 3]
MRHLEKPIRVAIHYCVVRSDVCDGWDVFIGVTLIGMFISYYLYTLTSICRKGEGRGTINR